VKKEYSIIRRINTWIFGPADLENKHVITAKNAEVLELFIEAIENIFAETKKQD
jgi:accessory gene regulator protein AgrB